MEIKVDRTPRFGQKTPTAYRLTYQEDDLFLEAFVDDRDVAGLGYERAISEGKGILIEHLKTFTAV